jgi:hypothetical protein
MPAQISSTFCIAPSEASSVVISTSSLEMSSIDKEHFVAHDSLNFFASFAKGKAAVVCEGMSQRGLRCANDLDRCDCDAYGTAANNTWFANQRSRHAAQERMLDADIVGEKIRSVLDDTDGASFINSPPTKISKDIEQISRKILDDTKIEAMPFFDDDKVVTADFDANDEEREVVPEDN